MLGKGLSYLQPAETIQGWGMKSKAERVWVDASVLIEKLNTSKKTSSALLLENYAAYQATYAEA